MNNNLNSVTHASMFGRTMANMGKLGAYYTDIGHCKRIGRLIKWPEDKKVCVLEPSCGDCTALNAVVAGFKKKELLHRYGVEMNTETYEKIAESMPESIDYAINADFLHGVRISNRVFSFCFANPPYGESDEMRLEQAFEEKLFLYLKKEALLVYVIPYPILLDSKFIRSFFARYQITCVFRFDDVEYAKYHQVAVFSYRRATTGYLKHDLDDFLEGVEDLNEIPYLPEENVEIRKKFPVIASKDEQVKEFTTKEFDADSFKDVIDSSNLLNSFGDMGCVKSYHAVQAGSPALPLTKEKAHLLAVCGAGSGIAGNEDEGTLHIQRGIVEIAEREEVYQNDKKDGHHIAVISEALTTMHILDASFNYHELGVKNKKSDN